MQAEKQPPKVYRPVGRCIYCGSTDNLEDEHLLPYSLGGESFLPKASCRRCACITGKFEETCARPMFGALRILYGYPTRHPPKRPKTLPVEIEKDGVRVRLEMPIKDIPAIPLLVVVWDPPGILLGRQPTDNFYGQKPVIVMPPIDDQHGRMKRSGALTGTTVTTPLRFEAKEFSQLLAKIAYVSAVAECGLDSFRPLVIDVILGRDPCASHFVGGTKDQLASPMPNKDHVYEVGLCRTEDKTYLCALIQLFRFLNLPTYKVIIGEPTDALDGQLLNLSSPIDV